MNANVEEYKKNFFWKFIQLGHCEILFWHKWNTYFVIGFFREVVTISHCHFDTFKLKKYLNIISKKKFSQGPWYNNSTFWYFLLSCYYLCKRLGPPHFRGAGPQNLGNVDGLWFQWRIQGGGYGGWNPPQVLILLEKNGKTCNLGDFLACFWVCLSKKNRLRRHFMVNYFNNVKKSFNFCFWF